MRFLSVFLIWLALPGAACAYIDPNTGGMIFQVMAPILAMITSAWLFLRDRIKLYWHRLVRLITGRKDASADDAPPPPKA